MSKIRIFAQQLNVKNDIQSVSGFKGVDELNKLKEKYKAITSSFSSAIKGTPSSMENFIQTRRSELFLIGLFEKFDRNSINISVVAEVSSGKSTFLNALIFGKKVLDAKMGETTAKVFKISYGEDENLDTLKQKIKDINSTTKDSISNDNFDIKNINIDNYIIDLKADNENLKKGIVLYDTPGFGTLNERVMSKLITESVNRSDAVILLLDISKGLKKDEARFIEEALSYIEENKRFIVLNKFDATFDEDDDMDEIQEQIDKVVEDTKKDLSKMSQNIDKSVLDKQTYYLSATKALRGKSKNESDVLEFSRFPIFEDSFWNRIVKAKKEIFADAVNALIQNASIIIEEAEKQKDSFQQIIEQTNSIVNNIEKVSTEIKEMVDKNSKTIEKVRKDTVLNTTIVFEKASIFENTMKSLIEQAIKSEVASIPNEDIKEEHFTTASKNAIQTIHIEFAKQHKEFVKSVSNDISEKENNVNLVIDNLNKDMKNDNFKELNLQEIPRVVLKVSDTQTIDLDDDSNTDINIKKEHSNTLTVSLGNDSYSGDDLADYAGNITSGAAAGAALATAIPIPIISTTIGAAVGAVGGLIKSLFFGSNPQAEQEARHRQEMEEMQREHQIAMQKLAEENYTRAIREAKKDFSYEMTSNLTSQISKFILENKTLLDNEYRNILSEITSTIYNAKNILNDMQTIIEDPSEQKKIVANNSAKIEELEKFIYNIEKCFKI